MCCEDFPETVDQQGGNVQESGRGREEERACGQTSAYFPCVHEKGGKEAMAKGGRKVSIHIYCMKCNII